MKVKMEVRVDFVEERSGAEQCEKCELHESCSEKVDGLHKFCGGGLEGFYRLTGEAYGVLAGADQEGFYRLTGEAYGVLAGADQRGF